VTTLWLQDKFGNSDIRAKSVHLTPKLDKPIALNISTLS
jgi:hypothetical protein